MVREDGQSLEYQGMAVSSSRHGLFNRSEREERDQRNSRPSQDTDVTRARECDGPGVPNLRHRGNDDAERACESKHGSDAPWETVRVVPVFHVVSRPGVPPEHKVLDEDNDGPDGAPVADRAEDVDERRVEVRRADDRDGDQAGAETRVSRQDAREGK